MGRVVSLFAACAHVTQSSTFAPTRVQVVGVPVGHAMTRHAVENTAEGGTDSRYDMESHHHEAKVMKIADGENPKTTFMLMHPPKLPLDETSMLVFGTAANGALRIEGEPPKEKN